MAHPFTAVCKYRCYLLFIRFFYHLLLPSVKSYHILLFEPVSHAVPESFLEYNVHYFIMCCCFFFPHLFDGIHCLHDLYFYFLSFLFRPALGFLFTLELFLHPFLLAYSYFSYFSIDSYIFPSYVTCHRFPEITDFSYWSTSHIHQSFADLVVAHPFYIPMPFFGECYVIFFDNIVKEKIIKHVLPYPLTGFLISLLCFLVCFEYVVRYKFRFNVISSSANHLSTCKSLIDFFQIVSYVESIQ